MPEKPEHKERSSGTSLDHLKSPEVEGGKIGFAASLKDSEVRVCLRESSEIEELVVGLAERGLWIERAKNGGGRISGHGQSVALSRVDVKCSLPRLEERLAGKGADAEDERGHDLYPGSVLRRAERRIAIHLGFHKGKDSALGEPDFPVGEALARKIAEAHGVDFHGGALSVEAASKKSYVSVGLEAKQYPIDPPQRDLLSERAADGEADPLHEDLSQASRHFHEVQRLKEQAKGAERFAGERHPTARRAQDLRKEATDLFGTMEALRVKIRAAALMVSGSSHEALTMQVMETLTEGRRKAALPTVKRALEGQDPRVEDVLPGRVELRDPSAIPPAGSPQVSEGRILVTSGPVSDRAAQLYAMLTGASRVAFVRVQDAAGGPLFGDESFAENLEKISADVKRIESELNAGNTVVIDPHLGKELAEAAPRTWGRLRARVQQAVGRAREITTGGGKALKAGQPVRAEDIFSAMERHQRSATSFGEDSVADGVTAGEEATRFDDGNHRSEEPPMERARKLFRTAAKEAERAQESADEIAERSVEEHPQENSLALLERKRELAGARSEAAEAESKRADATLLKRAALREMLAGRLRAQVRGTGRTDRSSLPELRLRLTAATALLRSTLRSGKVSTEPEANIRRIEEAVREGTLSATFDALADERGVAREPLASAAARYLRAKARLFKEQAGRAGKAAAHYREALRGSLAVPYDDAGAACAQLIEELDSVDASEVVRQIEANGSRFGALRIKGKGSHRQAAFEGAKRCANGYAEMSSLEAALERTVEAIRQVTEGVVEEVTEKVEATHAVLTERLEKWEDVGQTHSDVQNSSDVETERNLRARIKETEATAEIVAKRNAAVQRAAEQKTRAAELRKKQEQQQLRRDLVARAESLVKKARPFFAAQEACGEALASLKKWVSERIGSGRKKGAPASAGKAYLRKRERSEKKLRALQQEARADAREAAEGLSEIERELRKEGLDAIQDLLRAEGKSDLSAKICALQEAAERFDDEGDSSEAQRIRALDQHVLEALARRAGHYDRLHERAEKEAGPSVEWGERTSFAGSQLKEDLYALAFENGRTEGTEEHLDARALVQLGGPGADGALVVAASLATRKRQEQVLGVVEEMQERPCAPVDASEKLERGVRDNLSSMRSEDSLNRKLGKIREDCRRQLEACRELYHGAKNLHEEIREEGEDVRATSTAERRLVATARLAALKRRFEQRAVSQESAEELSLPDAIEAGRVLVGHRQTHKPAYSAAKWTKSLWQDGEAESLLEELDRFDEASELERVAARSADEVLFLDAPAMADELSERVDQVAGDVRAACRSLVGEVEKEWVEKDFESRDDAPEPLHALRRALARAGHPGEHNRRASEAHPEADSEEQLVARSYIGSAKLLERGVDADVLMRGAPGFQKEAVLKGAKPVLDEASATEMDSEKEESRHQPWTWALRLHLVRTLTKEADDPEELVEQFERDLQAESFEVALRRPNAALTSADNDAKKKAYAASAEYASAYLHEPDWQRVFLKAAAAVLDRGSRRLARAAFEEPDQVIERTDRAVGRGLDEVAELLEDPKARRRLDQLRGKKGSSRRRQATRSAQAVTDVLREHGRVRRRLHQFRRIANSEAAVSREEAYNALPLQKREKAKLRKRFEAREVEPLRHLARQAEAVSQEQTDKRRRAYRETLDEVKATRSSSGPEPHVNEPGGPEEVTVAARAATV